MARNITNENDINVFLNRDPITGQDPVEATQASNTDPIVIKLKGLNGFGTAGQVIKVNSTANQLEYADDNNTDTNYWDLTSNNLRPKSTSDRVIIGDTASFTTGTGFTLKGSSNGFYTNGILDINKTTGNIIYLACDKGAGRSNDIYFGDANSNTGSTDGVLLRQETDTSDNHTFKINSVASGSNTDRVNIAMPINNDTKLKVQSSTNAYLELKENDNNYVDLRYEVGASNDSFKNVFYHTDGNQSIFNYTHNVNASSRELIFYPKTEFDSDVLLNHTGGVSKASKLIFSNDTNSTTFSFEYSENTENFSFKKTNSTLWDYDSSNSPAKFTMYALFKFNTTTFQNSTNQTITLPTSTGQLALISDITAANYWSLTGNDLKTASTSYNLLLGKSSAASGNPKLDISGNAVIDGDVSLTGTFKAEDHFAINHSNPYTYIYDPTGYSTSNPYFRYHTNGTDLMLNLPSNQGSSSSFRFFTGNSAELMRLDAARTLKVFGTSSAKLELSNDDGLSSSSSIHFTNDVDGQKIFMEFQPSQPSDSFNLKYDTGIAETGLINYNSSNERLTIGKNLLLKTEDSGNTNLILTCGTTTGNGSIIVFGDTSDEDRYTFGYEKTSGGGRLAITDAAGTPQITYDSSVSEFDIGSTTLKTSGVIKNGSLTFTLPSSTGVLALVSQLPNNLFNVSGTTLTADPQGNDSNVCTQFKISSGAGSNGDCTLLIEADTDDTTETSNPIIKLLQDGGNNEGRLELTSDNYLQLTNPDSKVVIHSFSDIEIYAGSSPNEGIRIDSSTRNLEVDNNIEILNSSEAYLYFGSSGASSNLYIMGNSVDDFVIKMGTTSAGGDMKLFRNNTPGTGAGNWEGDIFITQNAGNLVLYGGYGISGGSGQNLRIGSGAIHGTVAYTPTSDDRLKTEEKPITEATDIIMKLKPQTYMKGQFMGTESPDTLPAGLDIESNNSKHFEAGLIAQEVYYDVPELRFMVKSLQDMSKIQELPAGVKPEDIHDQEWNKYGWSPDYTSSFSYTELIPYLIKMNQEQQNEINLLKEMINKLIAAPSFKSFKESLA